MSRPHPLRTLVGRTLVAALALSLSGQCVFAQEPDAAPSLKSSIAREAEALARAQTFTAGTGKNPYLVPAIAVMGGGTVLMVLGLGSVDECRDLGYSFSCPDRRSGLVAAMGAGVIAGGALLFLKGEALKDRRFGIDFTPRSVNVRMRVGR